MLPSSRHRRRARAAFALVLAAAVLVAAAAIASAQRKPKPGKVIWTFDTAAPSFGSGAAADLDGDGKPEVVFGCYFNDEHVYALEGESGKLKWKFKSEGGPIDTSILIRDVTGDQKPEVIFGDSARGTLFCLSGKRGKVVWKFKGQSGTDSPAAAADLDGDGRIEVVYGTMKTARRENGKRIPGPGHVNVLEGKTGKLRWTVQIPGHIQSEPGLVDLNGDRVLDVLVTTWKGDNKLHALNGKDGTELWSFDVGDSVYHGVSFFDFDRDQRPEIVVADRKGTVWMLEGESGKPKWKAKLEGERPGVVFAPTTLVHADKDTIPEIVVCGLQAHLLDARSGKTRWKTSLPGQQGIMRGVAAADVDGDGKEDLVFGSHRTLYALRATNGRELWTRDLSVGKDVRERIKQAPLLLDLDGDGALDVFIVTGRADGRRPQRLQNYGRAFAIRAGKGKASKQREWVTFRGDDRRGGRPIADKKQAGKKQARKSPPKRKREREREL